MQANFRGSGVALVTPFLADGTIDFQALEQLVEFHASNKTDYLVVLGTTAETATLNAKERKQVIDFIKDKNKGRMPLVIGVGGNCTQAVVEQIAETDFDGIAGILSVAPYYNKPGQEGICAHFMAVAEVCPVPIILYNVPGRTGVNMSAATTVKLAKASSKFVAVKEASGDMTQVAHIIKNKPASFQVISGDDGLAVPMISIGAEGVISVVANALPLELSNMVHAALNNDYTTAAQLHALLLEFIDAMFAEGNPAGVKAAMVQLKLIQNNLRLPLCPVSDSLYQQIETLLKEIKA
ncbi:4-hydroxy-tetrahydrodipicolinate synthase [Prolixibacteraceae bacterium JC049]|nr:4-hydroxy-tetrahydrodipicolinate synthase [Prolixibacteraceae bacterium JC049]